MKKLSKSLAALGMVVCMSFNVLNIEALHFLRTEAQASDDVIASENLGNIFRTKTQKFIINIESNALPVSYSVTDENGDTINSGQVTSDNIKDGRVELDLNIQKYGIYTLTVGDVSEEFSVCKSLTRTNITLGVSTHQNNHRIVADPDPVTEFITDTIAHGGFGTARDTALWTQTEKTEGNYAIASQTMEYIDSLVAKGIEPVLMLGYGNPIYGANFGGTSGNHQFGVFENDTQIDAYAKYCGQVAALLKGKVKYFEICNEPNLANNIKDSNGNVLYSIEGEQYAKTLEAAYKAITTANPQAEVIGYSLANSLHLDTTKEWLTASVNYTKGNIGTAAYDYIDIHPYCWQYMPEDSGVPDNVADFQEYFDARGLPNDKLWLTEVGYTSADCTTGVKDLHNQAMYMARYYTILKAKYGIDIRMNIYDLIDDGTDTTDQEQNFGMLHAKDYTTPYAAKPIYLAMSNLNDLVGNAYSITEAYKKETTYPVVGFSSGVYAYKYETPDTDVYMLWATKDNQSVKIDELQNAQFYDAYGNEITVVYSNGYSAGIDPIYAVVRNKKMYIDGWSSDGTVTIKGEVQSKNADETVSLLVVDTDSHGFNDGIKYVNETKTTADGQFEFSSPLDVGMGYKAYLNTLGNDSHPVCIEFYNTGNEKAVLTLKNTKVITSFSQISNTDSLTVDIGFKAADQETNYKLSYAMYKDNRLCGVESFDDIITPEDGITTKSYNINKSDIQNADMVKLFLWQGMVPICECKIIK